MEILCFFAAIIFFFTKSLLALYIPLIFLLFNIQRYIAIISVFILGFFWAWFHTYWVDDLGMPSSTVRVLDKVNLFGTIISLPVHSMAKTQFQLSLTALNDQPVKAIVQLSCFKDCPEFHVGETWSLQAKLKRPKNLGNPGYFDYEGSLALRHIHWIGSIKAGSERLHKDVAASLLQSFSLWVLQLRHKVAAQIEHALPQAEKQDSVAVVEALTLGLTHAINKDLWDLFRRTGTTHLMVISGAHISLVASLCYWVIKKCWMLSPRLCLLVPAPFMAGVCAFVAVFLYTLTAGFAVPAQRALVGCFLLMMCHFLGRRFTAWQAWRYALLLVLLFEPHACLMPGFYLSFLAVACLIATSERLALKGLRQMISLQVACLIGLLPLTLFWYSYAAFLGLIANLIAIPLVGYLLVPLCLVSVIINSMAATSIGMLPVDFLVRILLGFLRWIDHFSYVNWTIALQHIQGVIALSFGIFLLVFVPIRSIMPLGGLLILLAFFPAVYKVTEGEAEVNILDVGQGLSIVVHTAYHTLVYDTGMKFFQGSDMGVMAIIPYLQLRSVKTLDALVISHPDLDHRGGMASLEQRYPITTLLVDKVAFYKRGQSCHQYPPWDWDGVHFRFLPIKALFRDKNNSSCVLQISNQAGRVLLTGDIESLAENYLVDTYGEQLQSEFLVVAHHGSKTSSSKAFIAKVKPQYAIISAGFDNRYHFPHVKTLKTFDNFKARVVNTMDCGMVSLHLGATPSLVTACR